MKPSSLSSNSLIAALLWLLSALGSSHNAAGQQPWRWECGPMHFNLFIRGMYVDASDSSLYVTGDFDTVNGAYHRYMVRMRPDGSVQSMPSPPLVALTMIRWGGKLYAGGYSSTGGFFRLDDTVWTRLDSPVPNSIHCFYPYQGKLLVGGSFDDVPGNGNVESILKEYDGVSLTNFKGLDSVLYRHGVFAIAEFQGDLIVAGNLIPYAPANPLFKDILRWTGTSWQPIGNTGLPGGGLDAVNDMKVINGELYVAGQFYEFNGSPGNCIAKWDGTQWHRLGSGTGPTMVGIMDLETQGDTLLVGGTFRTMNGDTAWALARYWNGIWCGNKTRYPGPGVIISMVNYYDTLIVAGGIVDSSNNYACDWMGKLVEWDEGCFARAVASVPAVVPSDGAFRIELWPNPATDQLNVGFATEEAGGVRLTLTDALGRILHSSEVTAVPGFNTVDFDVRRYPAGIYTFTLSSSAAHEAVKFVKQ